MSANWHEQTIVPTGTTRRIVTAHRNGKSVVVDDSVLHPKDFMGGRVTELWQTMGVPAIPLESDDYKKKLTLKMPQAGGTRVRLAIFPPGDAVFQKAKEKGRDPVEDWRRLFGDDFGFHATDTVDFGLILSGELWIRLDDGLEIHLQEGDCIVNNGTRHCWRNKSSQDCVAVFFYIGAKRDPTQ